jgi:hypothetical protein
VRTNRLRAPGLLLLAALAAGCSKGPPPPADPAASRDALRAALDAWKGGDAPEALKARKPPVYVSDTDWRAGRRLIDYRVADGDEAYGGQRRCGVTLMLDVGGRAIRKAAVYAVETSPALTVTREDDQ